MKLRDWAAGRWPEIIHALMGPGLTTKTHGKCPKTGQGENRYRYSDVNGSGNYFCSCSDGSSDGFELLMCKFNCDFRTAAKKVESVIGKPPVQEELPEAPTETWAMRLQAEAIQSDQSKYLTKRGLEIAPGLRWHKKLDYYADKEKVGSFQAMLGAVVKDSRFITYHVTYLFPNGDKIRKILPSNVSLRGAAIELYPVEGETLGIAEGIETAIAAKMLFKVPVWSALNTSIMEIGRAHV